MATASLRFTVLFSLFSLFFCCTVNAKYIVCTVVLCCCPSERAEKGEGKELIGILFEIHLMAQVLSVAVVVRVVSLPRIRRSLLYVFKKNICRNGKIRQLMRHNN